MPETLEQKIKRVWEEAQGIANRSGEAWWFRLYPSGATLIASWPIKNGVKIEPVRTTAIV